MFSIPPPPPHTMRTIHPFRKIEEEEEEEDEVEGGREVEEEGGREGEEEETVRLYGNRKVDKVIHIIGVIKTQLGKWE
jgi:hypothetical protein